MSVLCLTGWQQKADALSGIAPQDALHFDYSAYDDFDAMLAALPREADLAIGWSLGGQLLARAIASGALKARSLLLISAPFQWVKSEQFEGMPAEAVPDISKGYRDNTQAMLKNLNALIALGDAQEKAIVRRLNADVRIWKNGAYWLDVLAEASCMMLDFNAFPPTRVVHGLNDKVIHPHNAKAFAERIPQSELLLWPSCAHAPHLHDAQSLSEMVEGHV